jgi:multicomponent Na+:H+ antiporter subunit E
MLVFVYALPMTLIWVLINGRVTLEILVIGFVASAALVFLLRPARFTVKWQHVPDQMFALVLYILCLFRDIFLSGIDVARRVLSPDMRLKPGIIAVSSQDPQRSPVLLALSADYISLTPGELVVEVEEDHMMYVHCLDVEASAAIAEKAQAQRLGLLERILGRDI